jgi:hypothetical protein
MRKFSLSLDLLAIGETHLTSTIPNNVVHRKLKNWKVFSHLRLDATSGTNNWASWS